MKSVMQRYFRTAAALGALGLAFASPTAHAVGTVAGTSISSPATVQFRVGNVAQPAVVSNAAAFVVDRVVNFNLTTTDVAFVTLTPGQTTANVTFQVAHSGNADQGFLLTATNMAGGTVLGGTDNADATSFEVWYHPTNPAAVLTDAVANPVTAGFVQGNIPVLTQDTTARTWPVYVRAIAPNTLTDAQVVGVQLIARATLPNSTTLEVATPGADTQGTVDVVLATPGNSVQSLSGFRVQAATVAVTKTSIVISDPFSGTTNPKAIPGAVVEYRITATNTGNGAAQNVGFTDAVQPGTTFLPGAYTGPADVEIDEGGTVSSCVAESGADGNGDGCFRTGTTLTVVPTATGGVLLNSGNNSVQFRFRVTVNAT